MDLTQCERPEIVWQERREHSRRQNVRLGVEAQLQPGVPHQQEGHPRHEVDERGRAGNLEVVDLVGAVPVREVDDDDQDEGDDPRDHRVQLPPAVHRQGRDLRQLRVVNLI